MLKKKKKKKEIAFLSNCLEGFWIWIPQGERF